MIIKINSDKERAKSLFKMATDSEKYRSKMISALKDETDQTFLAQSYYESIRQLILALMLLEGQKTIGENAPKETIDYLKKNKEFSEQDIFILQDLRIRRNQGMYEGKFIKKPYLENNQPKLDKIIEKIKNILQNKLK